MFLNMGCAARTIGKVCCQAIPLYAGAVIFVEHWMAFSFAVLTAVGFELTEADNIKWIQQRFKEFRERGPPSHDIENPEIPDENASDGHDAVLALQVQRIQIFNMMEDPVDVLPSINNLDAQHVPPVGNEVVTTGPLMIVRELVCITCNDPENKMKSEPPSRTGNGTAELIEDDYLLTFSEPLPVSGSEEEEVDVTGHDVSSALDDDMDGPHDEGAGEVSFTSPAEESQNPVDVPTEIKESQSKKIKKTSSDENRQSKKKKKRKRTTKRNKPQCTICYTKYAVGDRVAWSLNETCPHMYHEACITEWMEQNNSCPICHRPYDENGPIGDFNSEN